MRYYPGIIAAVGDNPPWNMFSLVSLGKSAEDWQSDVGGGGGGVSAGDLAAIILEDNAAGTAAIRCEDDNCAAGDVELMDLKVDLSAMEAVYGAIVFMSPNFTKQLPVAQDEFWWNRVNILQGLYIHNTTGDTNNVTLLESSTLIDNQPVANYGANLAAAGVAWLGSHDGLLELGVKVGETHNGQHYPQVVEALSFVSDQAGTYKNVSIYKSWDGSVWYPVDKAQYNSYGWSNGEYYVSNWRSAEAGAEKGRIVAFAKPEMANYFKIVYNNSAGSAITIHEIYALNRQLDVGFSTDFEHFRYCIAEKSGEEFRYNLATQPIVRVGLGPVTPSGETATLDPVTGLWKDVKTSSWYDFSIGAYINGDGQVYDIEESEWVKYETYYTKYLAADAMVTKPESIEQSQELSTDCNFIRIRFRPFNADQSAATAYGDVYRVQVFNDPRKTNTADTAGRKKIMSDIPAVPGAVGDVKEIRIYNNSDKKSTGFQVHVDPNPQDVSGEAVRAAEVGTNQIILKDDTRNIDQTRQVLGADKTGVGSFGDTSLVFGGTMAAWTEVAAGPAGNQYSVNYATGVVTTGNVVPAGATYSHSYMHEGADALKLSETGGAWTDCPSILTYASGEVEAGSYLILKMKSDLTSYSQERSRTAKIVPRYSY